MSEYSYRAPEMLIDICSSRARASQLIQRGKDYNVLLSHLLKNDYFREDSQSVPTGKELMEQIGLTSYWYKKYLNEIYHDLVIDHENLPAETVSGMQCYIYLSGREGKHSMMKVNGIQHVPQRGDMMSLPGFKAQLDGNFFYVTEVSHEFTEGEHVIRIWVKSGFYNSYWELRKDRARILNELTHEDFSQRSDYDLQQELIKFNKRW
ncbi:hypothetical protein Oweho_3559 [Owenweeksia hongkongensis DSM 17368]|uniref:Uncharacterized protein n=1 Tax=Owenweeksia hongkongensis (strain DSM 17368 / CIP 108786 / JCM 12287 / NRRL B-23963 / UST20020801) TaxID=926562 RepID=G8R7A0_OWEHD|nr:hypothetical protein [Owenweeksia hongkongensis]AEV34507.1 hypothetical protein Oweho_3559 [Owenweeksia hongkongensis DSM 17368]